MAEPRMNRAILSFLKDRKKPKPQQGEHCACMPKIIKSGKLNTAKAVGQRKWEVSAELGWSCYTPALEGKKVG